MSYYDTEKFIIIKGSLPPPIGGVSIHIKRVLPILKEMGIPYFNWNIASDNYLQTLLKILFKRWPNNTVFHLQSTSNKHILVTILLSYLKPFKVYLTNHNIHALNVNYRWKVFLFKWLHLRLDKCFYVNEKTPMQYNSIGVKTCNKMIKISPFLPPNENRRDGIIATYPESLLDFMKNKKPLLIANAYKIVFIDDTDLYGFDMCIKLIQELVEDYPKIGLIFAIANLNHQRDYVETTINGLGKFKKHVYILSPQYEIWPVFSSCSILLRPTYTDGYGISIDEALNEGSYAIASDVCKRHPDCILFKNRDQNDFKTKVKSILERSNSIEL